MLTTHHTTLDAYWTSVADHYSLTLGERDALAAFLPGVEVDESTTSAGVIADSMRAGVVAASRESESADSATGLNVGHGVLVDGTATITHYASTADYMLTCISTGERVGYRVNRDAYATPADIPASMRKARAIAAEFQAAHDAGLMRAAIAAYVQADELRGRMNAFSRA